MAFTTHRKVRFQHCDPAGIVFYPRYFEMINSVVEDWFEEVVQRDFNQLHVESGTGVPTAAIDTQFHAPSRLGERLTFELAVQAVGRSSLTLQIIAYCGDQKRLTSRSTLVYVDLNSGQPMPWTEAMRQHFTVENL
ncbi:thioesterase family protein [Vreelandella titanicae]|uniref:acyl-CoA thioesterase n=1 Tax=Halomonadaceae TaxID=28256 RepID=UPI0003461D2A|nr:MULTISPECIES: thioesterase family protein [Halomonas]NAO99035.1 acyl-CoA thioesterase [Halomonas sp. MG34]QGQ69989.1 acyl-CoA thioesterase [Halomonas sp. PA16-9]MCE7520831.1 acyl-CoA thioesterase [Halomonas titanicae]NVE92043.1 acyl-CoA thioesterase [Halomonas titanicae]PKH62221.1 acyl-CoA thioesterase [Halomonas sp. Choline-3u-9]